MTMTTSVIQSRLSRARGLDSSSAAMTMNDATPPQISATH
jgi:hypothetical protein